MKTVVNNVSEYIIKKSKFITYMYQVSNKNEIIDKINEIKLEHPNATHICYAYIISNQEKLYDDGEPSGTAGAPILSVLKKENLTNVLCIIVRYFGGIKLGAGGLIRAYGKSCKDAIIIKDLIEGYKIKISFKYEYSKEIDYLLKDCTILEKSYDIQPIYIFNINTSIYNQIINKLNLICNIDEIENIYI